MDSSLDPSTARFVRSAAACGFAMVALILVLGVGGSILIGAGNPPSGTTDETVLKQYYGHGALAPLELWQVPAAVLGLVFFAGLRARLASEPAAHRVASLAMNAFVLMAAGFAVVSALTAALVQQASAGASLGTLFRFYDVLYNSHLDIASGAVVLLTSLAVLKSSCLPRWTALFGFVVVALYPVLALTPWVTVPEAVRPAVMLLFVAWFLSLATVLLRSTQTAVPANAPAPATGRPHG
jgi:hypothetical protein